MGIEIAPLSIGHMLDTEDSNLDKMIENAYSLQEQIQAFIDDSALQGAAYDSTKVYYRSVHLPMIRGFILYAEEKILENAQYRNRVQTYWGGESHVSEDKLTEQRNRIIRLRQSVEELPILSSYVWVLNRMELMIKERIDDIYEYVQVTNPLYSGGNIELLLGHLEQGRRCMGAVTYHADTKTFQMGPLNLSWATAITDFDQQKYEKMARKRYGDYLNAHPGDLDKLVIILRYEDAHPQAVEKIDTFLKPLDTQDIIGIKFIVYSAQEPYRGLWIKYLDQYNIVDTKNSGVFVSGDNTLTFDVTADRNDKRGSYYTFFHECGHAIDYFSGGKNYFTDSFKDKNGNNLTSYIYQDVENNFNVCIGDLFQNDSSFSNWSKSEQEAARQTVINNLLNDRIIGLGDSNAQTLQDLLIDKYEILLKDAVNNCPSDIYGGATNNIIVGDYGHKDIDANGTTYWFKADGSLRRDPNKECFAEWYSHKILQNDSNLTSIETYLPESEQFMNKIISELGENP